METAAVACTGAGATGLRALAGIAMAVDASWSDVRLLRAIADGIHATLGDRCSIGLTGTGGFPPTGASTHPDPVRAELEPVFASGAGFDTAEAVVPVEDPTGAWCGLRQYATFPVIGNGRPIGLFVITRTTDRPQFSDEDLAFGAAVAALLGVVVVNRRMLAHTTTVVDELRAQAEVVDQISDALITCDEHMRVLSWNAAAEKIYGYAPSEAIGCDLSALLSTRHHTLDGEPLKPSEVLAAVEDARRWDGELHERHADGTPLVVLTSISAADGPGARHGDLVLVNRDVTAQRREEHLATHDPLTGLPNRRMLNDKLHEAFARARRSGRTLALLFIDLDGFKPINDRHGHATGDTVLTTTAERLVNAVRHTDTVGRLGGDEFLVILENAGTDDNIRTVAGRIIEGVSRPMEIAGISVTVHASIGIAPSRDPATDPRRPDQLLAAADHAMYLAKNNDGQPVFADAS